MNHLDENLIDGRWVKAGGDVVETTDPSTALASGTIRLASIEDVDAAARAARAAFPAWSSRAPADRATILLQLRDLMVERAEDFAAIIAEEVGSPLWFSRRIGVAMPIRNLELAVRAADELFEDEIVGSSVVVREAYGVVAAITPWNAPLHQIVAKVGAALAAGCTVVLKPSEFAARTARLFGELVQAAGAPPGVFNMVFGGAEAGEALVAHPEVDVISFTGSGGVGQKVAATAARGVKKVALELGGKSATILLDDADVDAAAAVLPALCFSNSGQVCVSQSRLLVPTDRLAEVEAALVRATSEWTIGSPTDEKARLGPVASRAAYDRVRRYIDGAVAEGARLVVGGSDAVESLPGFYVRPTIFSDVRPDMTIAREEVFGPVLAIMPYGDVEEAVAIANMLPLGLSGGVWSRDVARAASVARRMQTGQVAINGAPQNLATPFGGYKQSGYGRENGRYGVEEFLQYKAIHGVAPA